MAAAGMLRAKFTANWIQRKVAKAVSKAVAPAGRAGGHKVCHLGADVTIGNVDDVEMRVTAVVERTSQVHVDALGDAKAAAYVTLSCKEGVDEFQAGEAAASLTQLYVSVDAHTTNPSCIYCTVL